MKISLAVWYAEDSFLPGGFQTEKVFSKVDSATTFNILERWEKTVFCQAFTWFNKINFKIDFNCIDCTALFYFVNVFLCSRECTYVVANDVFDVRGVHEIEIAFEPQSFRSSVEPLQVNYALARWKPRIFKVGFWLEQKLKEWAWQGWYPSSFLLLCSVWRVHWSIHRSWQCLPCPVSP